MIAGDSLEYEFITEEIQKLKLNDIVLTCEIGLRRGLGSKTIMDAVISKGAVYYRHIAVDPYGSLNYQHCDDSSPTVKDYTDYMKVETLVDLHKYTQFAFFEFPDGVDLDFFDEDSNKSNVIADYGLVYNNTNLIDLRGNVVLTTHNNDTLFAKQLYFDQNREWLFTNLPVRFRTNNEIINGNGFDSNSDFTNAEVLETFGIIYIDE